MHGEYGDGGRYRGAQPVTVTATQSANNSSVYPGQCILMGFDLSDGSGTDDFQNSNSVTAPTALQTITSITLPQGEYTVQWTTELTGTPGAGDLNNVSLLIGGTFLAGGEQLGQAGIYQQKNAEVQVAAGGQLLKIIANANAVAGSVYRASFVAIPTFPSFGTIQDSGQQIANVFPAIGGNDRQWYGDNGILITNALSVKTVNGTISGTVYVYPIEHPIPD